MGINVVVNARFLTQKVTGVQRYGIEISRALKKLDPTIKFITAKNIIHTDLANELDAQIIGFNTGHVWENLDLPLYLSLNGSPLLVNLANTAPLFYRKKILALHDIAFLKFPKTFSLGFRWLYRILTPLHVKNSRHLVTVSEFSKKEIQGSYGINKDTISVVYNAAQEVFKPCADSTGNSYILAVSSLSHQKNFHGLIDAFSKLNDKSVFLYVVGGFNHSFANHDLMQVIDNTERVRFLGRVDDMQLAKVYSNAKCFIFPSFYEGFGLPPLEAQSCGCPVIVSDVASLPEVYLDSVRYCNPHDTDNIKKQITDVLNSEVLREDLIKKGYQNTKRFTWGSSADRVYALILRYK
ncbi:MAG: glycosyltransferase family 4 protein [Methyloprofundus sp.]|nr:glycosyltransferase family 4 protein [Methyloprofundus sp.]